MVFGGSGVGEMIMRRYNMAMAGFLVLVPNGSQRVMRNKKSRSTDFERETVKWKMAIVYCPS